MTRVALYMRCSTEEQATEGLSIEGQRSVLLSYCRAKGLEVAEEYVDEDRSGRLPGRPEFQRMIAVARGKRPPWSMILVIKWDRFARSTEDAVVYKGLLTRQLIAPRCSGWRVAVGQPPTLRLGGPLYGRPRPCPGCTAGRRGGRHAD